MPAARSRPALDHATNTLSQAGGSRNCPNLDPLTSVWCRWGIEAMSRPRVLLADDHRIVSEGLKGLLADDFELVGMVEDGRALVSAAKTIKPDVIVADITMPHMNGIDAVSQLKQDNP